MRRASSKRCLPSTGSRRTFEGRNAPSRCNVEPGPRGLPLRRTLFTQGLPRRTSTSSLSPAASVGDALTAPKATLLREPPVKFSGIKAALPPQPPRLDRSNHLPHTFPVGALHSVDEERQRRQSVRQASPRRPSVPCPRTERTLERDLATRESAGPRPLIRAPEKA